MLKNNKFQFFLKESYEYITRTVHFADKISDMKLTAALISTGVLSITLQIVSTTWCGVTNYSSPVSYYTKLETRNAMNFGDWVSKCEGKVLF